MSPDTNPLVVALDTADLARLEALARAVVPPAGRLKVGLEAFAACGPAAVAAAAAHAPVFCDLKLHDIPNTVAGAARAAAGMGIDLLTVHAAGGAAMVAAAAEAAPDVGILAVTVLTSLDDAALAAVGQPPAAEQVPRLAALAVGAGAAGVVCAPTDLAAVRTAIGDGPLVVTPGIRPAAAADPGPRAEAPDPGPRAEAPDPGPRAEAPDDDQARVATPRAALEAGADLLVVGRPVTSAPDPAAAAAAILAELRR